MRRFVLALILLATGFAAYAANAQVPEVSARYRLRVEQNAVRYFGLDAPVSALAAQLQQESSWNAKAASPFANGLAQFTPQTAAWLPTICPELGKPDPWNETWSLGAQSCYMAWLHKRVRSFAGWPRVNACSQFAFALRAYNGGEGWLNRERSKAAQFKANPNHWLIMEPYRVRAGWAHKENVGYPRRIMLLLEPRYRAAGWTAGSARCK